MTLLACACLGLLVPAGAGAKTFEVTRHNDPDPGRCKPNDCSLREAIIAANKRAGKDVVVLPDRRPAYRLSQPNSPPLVDEDEALRGDLDITGRVTLTHPGRGKATVDAQGIDRALEVIAPTVIRRLRLTGGGNVSEAPPRAGRAARTSATGSGGGIESNAPLTLRRSAVVGNTASAAGGILVFAEPSGPESAPLRLIRSLVARNETNETTGGGVQTIGSQVVLVRSRVTRNRSANSSGGLAVFEGGVLRARYSTVAGNRARYDSAGIQLYNAAAVIRQSTISDNVAAEISGGGGAGISLQADSRLSLTNSTVAGNASPIAGGGIATTGSMNEVTLNSVTVARNRTAGTGGGIYAASKSDTWNVVNSVVALNRAGGSLDDCYGAFGSGGGNLFTSIPVTCEGFDPDTGGDFLTNAPKLGALKRNGGPTKTIALRRGSPAINKAVESEAPNRDQRGVKRKNPDIGAFERR
jgi:CSLREA domain-containing protein